MGDDAGDPPPDASPRPDAARGDAGVGGELLLFDDFEYDVGREDSAAESIFRSQGWTGAKTEQSAQPGANGWLYTQTSVPGFSGTLPGIDSTRVLAIEARPGSEGGQTDFYLEYGDGENPAYDDYIPGNVWFQFWIYINNSGDEMSLVDARNKFIYPCNGMYPCHTGLWLVSLTDHNTQYDWTRLDSPSSMGGFISNAANVFEGIATVECSDGDLSNCHQLGHTNSSERVIPNRWTLVKIHIDTSTESGRYEVWMRTAGGAWTKTAEWIDGVTPNFSWRISPEWVGGHRTFRMPTTMGRAGGSGYDSWYYLDDFAMATAESALPVYP